MARSTARAAIAPRGLAWGAAELGSVGKLGVGDGEGEGTGVGAGAMISLELLAGRAANGEGDGAGSCGAGRRRRQGRRGHGFFVAWSSGLGWTAWAR